ncbi:hypothetical protein AFFFEF_02945 [Methylorubrum extorquens]
MPQPCPDDDILSLVRRQCALARAEAFADAMGVVTNLMVSDGADPVVRQARREIFDALKGRALASLSPTESDPTC